MYLTFFFFFYIIYIKKKKIYVTYWKSLWVLYQIKIQPNDKDYNST